MKEIRHQNIYQKSVDHVFKKLNIHKKLATVFQKMYNVDDNVDMC